MKGHLLLLMALCAGATAQEDDPFRAALEQTEDTRPAKLPGGYVLPVPVEFPDAPWPADNPLTPDGIALGRRLFNDGRLSEDHQVSCATCHWDQLAFSDAPRFSTGTAGKEGTRNSLPLMNLAWKPSYFWDGRATTLREQVFHPIKDPLEMNESPERVIEKLQRDARTAKAFERAFGSPGVTQERLGLALEQYLLTLTSGASKVDRAARGGAALSAEEELGKKLFLTDPAPGVRGAGCAQCHSGPLFTNHQFMNNGLDAAPKDTGRERVTRSAADRGKFMVPSLRNLLLTDPYMHDGRFETLDEVVAHYDRGIAPSDTLDPKLRRAPLDLTAEEKQALVAFLEALTESTE